MHSSTHLEGPTQLFSTSASPHPAAQLLTPDFVESTQAAGFNAPTIVEADLEDGTLLRYGTAANEDWRIARVQTYAVPRQVMGPQELGRAKLFHQDYRHYKYYGFAGKGAKTSWAHNPKYNVIYDDEPFHYQIATYYSTSASTSSSDQLAAVTVTRAPLRDSMDGPLRPLTPAEKLLIKEFRMHSHSYDGHVSVDDRMKKGGGAQFIPQAQKLVRNGSSGTAPVMTHEQLQRARRQGVKEPSLSFGLHHNMYSTMYNEVL